MKMKQISAVIIGMVLVSDMSAQEEGMAVPSVDQVEFITLSSFFTGWGATFYQNGSARLTYGGGFLDSQVAAAPKGSFSFKQTYNLLLPHRNQRMNSMDDTQIGLFDADQKVVGSFFIHDRKGRGGASKESAGKEVVRTLMHELCAKVIPFDKDAFENLLAEHPLVRGDPPAPHVYKKKRPADFKAAWRDTGEERALSSPEEEDEGRPPSRLWLCAGILSALCAGVLWLIRRKR